ncbi:hypothetical protein MSG28_001287 [Choristoneura fumiferana]|uniref:Uncharacterized protein n=1 Tax=Choristoneura fumiferana TaxID=7141 RepID=A0ACC0K4X0_CHOFU|nr:hypothetical protein MSG28_001287 [Choristoneura fumiferana]
MIARNLFRVPAVLRRCVSSKATAPVCPAPVIEPETKITTLANGVQVATEQTDSPLCAISMFVEAGPRFEVACNNGITHFIEHMAYKGFISMRRSDLEDCVLTSPMRVTAETTQELQRFTVLCPPDYALDGTAILCKIMMELDLNEREVESERCNIALELADADRDPKAVVFENLIKTAFQGTSLGQPVIGPTRNLERFDADFVRTYMSSHYQPWRVVFATSGPISHEDMIHNVCKNLGNMQNTLTCTPDKIDCRYTGSEILYRDDTEPFAHVCLAVEAPGFTCGEYMTMLLLKNAVGSWSKTQAIGGAWPELAMRCVDTDLCHSFESFYIAYRDTGLWGIYFVANGMQIEDMVYNIQNVWMHLCTTIGPSDIERARNVTKFELAMRRNGSLNSSLDIGKEVMYKSSRPTMVEYDRALNRIVLGKEWAGTADYHLYDRCPVVSCFGPTEGMPEYTRTRAGMYWLRL